MTPRVSAIIATYNYGRFLGQAIESVRSQTQRDWELVVVDDGSTDNTAEVISGFMTDPRIRYFRTDHVGQSRAKNRGMELAKGRFFAFLDADDCWRPRKLERQLAIVERHSKVGVVYCRRFLFYDGDAALILDDRPMPRGEVADNMFRQNFVCFSSALVRRQVFDHIGGFDPRIGLAIDYDWWLRVARHYHFEFVDEPLVEYRTGHANLSQRVVERLDTALAIMRRHECRVDGRPNSGRRTAFADTYLHRGLLKRNSERWSSLCDLARAMAIEPMRWATWRAAAASAIPTGIRRMVRSLLGRPNWESTPATTQGIC